MTEPTGGSFRASCGGGCEMNRRVFEYLHNSLERASAHYLGTVFALLLGTIQQADFLGVGATRPAGASRIMENVLVHSQLAHVTFA